MSVFSRRLREQRMAQGKKQADMSALLGIGLRSYQAYEGGDREPNFEKLVVIARFLKVSTDYLLGLKDTP